MLEVLKAVHDPRGHKGGFESQTVTHTIRLSSYVAYSNDMR